MAKGIVAVVNTISNTSANIGGSQTSQWKVVFGDIGRNISCGKMKQFNIHYYICAMMWSRV